MWRQCRARLQISHVVPNGGLVVTAAAFTVIHRVLIARLAAQYGLPAVYPRKTYVADGGLISYGFDVDAQIRLAAGYVNRILRGEKPSEMPVQAPTKYDLTVNLKAAQGAGSRDTTDGSRSRRRGDRISPGDFCCGRLLHRHVSVTDVGAVRALHDLEEQPMQTVTTSVSISPSRSFRFIILRRSTGRCCSRKRAPPNTRPASTSRLSAVGWCCIGVARSSGSRRRAPSCSLRVDLATSAFEGGTSGFDPERTSAT